MCSFFGIITENKKLINYVDSEKDNLFQKLKYRGPDIFTTKRPDDKSLFAGFVLAINDFIPQPIEKNGSWLLWNGEIYKYPKTYTSDTKYLIDYLADGGINQIFNTSTRLDGEYAIAFYEKNKLYLITDDFFTKPLSFSTSNNTIIFSSYESAIKEVDKNAKINHALPNSLYVFDTNTYTLIERRDIYKWDFNPKHNSYDDWNVAYVDAVSKRCNADKNIFLPLSSGYDSGGICAEIIEANVPCTMYSYLGQEDKGIMSSRINLIKNSGNKHIYINPEDNFEENFRKFYDKVENWIGYHSQPSNSRLDGKPYMDVYHAYSCYAHFVICEHAKKSGYTICLSGHGADEIYSDYFSPNTSSSSVVKGDYTGWRVKWPNFDMGYGRNILGMFDRTAGACGIETRYPYLDRDAVQNFLWLSDKLKNKYYKQCQHQIMEKRKFPFDKKNLKVPLRVFNNDPKNIKFKKYLLDFYKKNNITHPSWIKI